MQDEHEDGGLPNIDLETEHEDGGLPNIYDADDNEDDLELMQDEDGGLPNTFKERACTKANTHFETCGTDCPPTCAEPNPAICKLVRVTRCLSPLFRIHFDTPCVVLRLRRQSDVRHRLLL